MTALAEALAANERAHEASLKAELSAFERDPSAGAMQGLNSIKVCWGPD